ncbi:unnamed protein product [Blepharisma stoltei]|uniref:Uncharacterized protein n=1 Tax=Blepharisma stoltei TaxID=1481888 RepID=A0AAU9JT42_9CILI|nr:unnamed protein product [Blepharisma stoltei]
MDLLSELIGEESIYNFLKQFPEKDWLEVIKKTLLYGIQTFEVINSAGVVHLITVKSEKEKLSDVENLNIHERHASEPNAIIGEKLLEDTQIKKQSSKLHINKNTSTPRSQKAISKTKITTIPIRKTAFDTLLTSKHNAKIKTSRNSSDLKSKTGIKNVSNDKKFKEKFNIKKSHVLFDSSDKLYFSMKHKNKSLSSSSTTTNAQISESFTQFFPKDNENWLRKENQQILVNIELNLDQTSKSALNYTTSPSDDE